MLEESTSPPNVRVLLVFGGVYVRIGCNVVWVGVHCVWGHNHHNCWRDYLRAFRCLPSQSIHASHIGMSVQIMWLCWSWVYNQCRPHKWPQWPRLVVLSPWWWWTPWVVPLQNLLRKSHNVTSCKFILAWELLCLINMLDPNLVTSHSLLWFEQFQP